MSINRQKSRMRLNNNRDNTVYFNSFDSVLDSDPTTTVMPSIEESLQDWLSKNSSSQESDDNLFDMCQCCHQNDCKNHEFISKHIQKLENDIRLAAVIGQSLLQKHEHYVAESSIVKNRLEQEIELLQEKTRQLEQGLIESDNLKQIYLEEKMKSIWEYQKTQKTLDETTLDLDTCNNRCLKLSAELKNYINEVEKLRVFKLMARQADIQEDILNSKLEDVKQELAISRRAELMLESKLRKLKSKYETVSIAYEKLKVEQQEMSITKEFQLDVVWLKESNEKLRKEVLKLTNALLLPHSAAELQIPNNNNNNQNYLIELIKELVSANNKLKVDLLDCTDLLVEYRNNNKIDKEEEEEEGEEDDDVKEKMNSNNNVSWMSMSAPQANDERILSSSRLKRIIPTKTGNSVNQSIIDKSSSSSTMMHYDDVKGKKAIEEAILPKNKIEEQHTILSPSISSTTTTTSHSVDFSLSPFHQLHHQIVNMLKRINQTETRTLNRQLRRAFDIFELSNMSNSIIENIITDIDHLKMQFLWIEDVKQELWIHDVSMADFFPLMGVVQEMLKEISQLKMTLNDLQVDYVKKIEKNDIRLKEEALGKQQLQIQQRTMKESTSYHGPLSWLLSNIFQKRPENIPDQSSNLVPSYRPFHTRFSTSEICTTASAYSRSKPKRVPSVPTVVDKDESVVQCQKSIDRYGPSSSFPTTRSTAKVDNHFAKRRSTHTTHGTTADQSSSFPLLRASQSVGTVRRSQASPALEYIVRKKKRSSLGLNSLFTTDLLGLPHHQSSPDEIANRFPTSWLGNK